MSNKNIYSSSSFTEQRGSALIVCLVMMLILTFVSMSGLDTAIMNEKMASNAQSKSQTFHAADSAVGALTTTIIGGDITSLEQALAREGSSDDASFDINDSKIASTIRAEYLGEIAIGDGTSSSADESTTLLKGFRFQLRGSSTNASTGATTTIFRGAEYH